MFPLPPPNVEALFIDMFHQIRQRSSVMVLSPFIRLAGGSRGLTLDHQGLRVLRELSVALQVRVIFCGTDTVKVSTIRAIYKGLKNESATRLILVVQSKMTFKSREAIKDIFSSKVEIFQITDLLANITKHFLIPKHEVLMQEEKNELLKKFSVEDKQLPRMLESDAIARYYGLEKGTVVKVTYDGELTGSHVTYRCIM